MSSIHTSTDSNVSDIEKEFKSELSLASPGRINLIGEHTDYNKGYVLPTAIDKKIYFQFRKNNTTSRCNVYSENFKASLKFDLNSITKSDTSWENYILGIIDELQKKVKKIEGFDCIITSELPIGAGISSSAAIECGLATGLNELFQLNLSKLEIVHISLAAENNFVGSQCGIMDQYASVLSKKDHLILLDCLSLEAEYIPANFKACKILLINSMVSHSIADGEYNTRRIECETALQILQNNNNQVKTLRDVNQEMLNLVRDQLSEIQYNRVLYVIQENKRVLKSVDFLRSGDLEKFGGLMYQSHYGLRDLYEVSCKELDFLVQYTEDKDFIYGSRMMGGGFGGCTINIIEEEHIEEFIAEVCQAYKAEFNKDPETIIVLPDEGTVIN